MLTILSADFEIEYYDTLDNHSRVEPRKEESLALESMVRVTTWYLKERLRDNDRIVIRDRNHYGRDIATFRVLGHNVIGVHGDKDKPSTIAEKLTMFTQQ